METVGKLNFLGIDQEFYYFIQQLPSCTIYNSCFKASSGLSTFWILLDYYYITRNQLSSYAIYNFYFKHLLDL